MHPRIRLLIPVVAIATAATVAGCGTASSGSGGTPTASTTSPTTTSGASSGDRAAQLEKVNACLNAAGVALPSGFPSGAPSGFPSGAPSGFPSGAPSGGFSRPAGAGPGGGAFSDPKIQSALKACGITLSGVPAGSGQ